MRLKWATGGNLLDYMEKRMVESDPEGKILPSALCWALDQIRGLADGIRGLHAIKARHGDIKPNNILLFPMPENQSKYKLVIADAGLAKIHQLSTSKRSKFTTTIHASMMHQPPESDAVAVKLSRRYDVWSFGCVLFEMLVWLVRGPNGYKTFLKSMKGSPSGEVLPFWFGENKVKKLRPIVETWKSRLSRSIQEDEGRVPLGFKPALSKLLKLVMTRLLVIDLGEKEEGRRGKKNGDYRGTAYRADAVEMWEDIGEICGNVPLDVDQLRVSMLHELTRQIDSNGDHDFDGMPEGLDNVHLSRNVSRNLTPLLARYPRTDIMD
jgi:serine/threonine protein kinase